MQFDFHLLLETGIVILENRYHFGPGEFLGQFAALGQGLANQGTAQKQPVILAVGAGLHGTHAAALVAVEGPVNGERLQFQRPLWDLMKDMLGIEGAIVIAHTSVVTADYQVATAVVLAEASMEQSFTGVQRSASPWGSRPG